MFPVDKFFSLSTFTRNFYDAGTIMKNVLTFFGAVLILFGAGCTQITRQPSDIPADRRPAWLIPREGVAIVTQATLDPGPRVSVTDGTTGRILTTELPPTFSDGQGTYTTNKPGETVRLQLAVGGTVAEDGTLFRNQPGLEHFEDGEVGEWKVTAAYQPSGRRWIVRAAQPDATQPEEMYHVIECLGTEDTNNLFWDGCRTIIEKATIDQSRAPSPD